MNRTRRPRTLVLCALVLVACSTGSDDGAGGAGDSGASDVGDSGVGGAGDSGASGAADSGAADGGVGTEADVPQSLCAAEIAAGAAFSCARSSDGRVWCWGNNEKGQLTGDDLSTSVPIPRPVAGLRAAVVQLAAGANHACAALSDATVWCWGANGTGQLGIGTMTDHASFPVQVHGLEGGVLSLTANGARYQPLNPDDPEYVITEMNHTCAVRVDGTVWCWGSDFTGQVGGGKKGAAPVLAPVQVKTVGAGFAQVSAGGMYTCARREDGKAECWGYDNWGQLGDGNTDAVVRSPVQVVGLGDIRHIAAGGEHACAIVSDGSVWCWGGNGGGECGVEPAHPLRVVSPTVVPLSAKAASLVAAGGYTCAGLEDGYVWCWGSNVSGTLGTGKVDPGYPYNATNVPATVILVDGVTGLASTAEHICATTSVDQVWCWGDSRHGALGNGVANDSALPDPMPTPVKVVSFCP